MRDRPHSLIEPRRKVCKRRPTSILPQVQRHNMLEKKKSLLLVTEARLRNSQVRRLSRILGSLVEPLCPSEQPQQRHSTGNISHGRVLGAGKESSRSSGRPCQHLLRFGRSCPRETGSRVQASAMRNSRSTTSMHGWTSIFLSCI